MQSMAHKHNLPRIGIDLGGTKIEGLRINPEGKEQARHRIPTPQGDYNATLDAIAGLVAQLQDSSEECRVGIGIPGSLSPKTGRVQNANSTWLNGRPLADDLTNKLGCPVTLANDANCFALSEAVDGAGQHADVVLGVILGTGCGSGIVVNKSLLEGPHRTSGEWGHTPLPWQSEFDQPDLTCWCGRHNCMETWVSGPGLANDHARATGELHDAAAIAAKAANGDKDAQATLTRHADRLARGLSVVVNIVDPDVIVLGGGLSQMPHLYRTLPELMKSYVFSDDVYVDIRPPKWGDASGVRGAAWL